MYNLIISRHTFLHNKWDINMFEGIVILGISRPCLLVNRIRACLIVIGIRAFSLTLGILRLHENGILAFPLTNGILRLDENGIRARLLVNGVRALLLANGTRACLLASSIRAGAVLPNHPILLVQSVSVLKNHTMKGTSSVKHSFVGRQQKQPNKPLCMPIERMNRSTFSDFKIIDRQEAE